MIQLMKQMLLPVTACALFGASFLLFLMEPLVGKMLLPVFGGSPMVWNSCLAIFQLMLLGAYLYVFLVTRYLSFRWQVVLQISIWIIVLIQPSFITHSPNPPGGSEATEPLKWLCLWLLIYVSVPFAVLATTSSMLQAWVSRTRHARAKNPYILFAASNAGSLAGLLAYPFILEPNLNLDLQAQWWLWLYCALLVLLGLSLIISVVLRQPSESTGTSDLIFKSNQQSTAKVTPSKSYGVWFALAAVPSAQLLGVTNYILTDIAAVPLFWVIPLALYLMTFILAFSVSERLPFALLGRMTAFLSLPLCIAILADATEPAWLLICLHLMLFGSASLLCHGLLSIKKPAVVDLTKYYLWLAFGGAAGGLAMVFIAPFLSGRMLEYPAIIIAACYLARINPQGQTWEWPSLKNSAFDVSVVAGLLLLGWLFADWLGPDYLILRVSGIFLVAALFVYSRVHEPSRYAIALCAILVFGAWVPSGLGQTLVTYRNFFGVTRVIRSFDGKFNHIVHGATIHGSQMLAKADQCSPTTYFHPSGPFGQFWNRQRGASRRVGVIGLGVASLVCYAGRDDVWTFYEINSAMQELANNDRYFTFLKNSPTNLVSIELGDARMRLRQVNPGTFDVMVLDAFSSDAIPVHLLTHQAVNLYLSVLKPDGLVIMNISNRYFDLKPVVADIAASLGAYTFVLSDLEITPELSAEGKFPSEWIILSQHKSAREILNLSALWQDLAPAGEPVWTDQFSNPVGALRFFN